MPRAPLDIAGLAEATGPAPPQREASTPGPSLSSCVDLSTAPAAVPAWREDSDGNILLADTTFSSYDLTVPLDILEIAASGEKTTPFNMIIRINVIRKNRRCGNTNTRTIYVDIRTRSNTEMIVAKEKKLYLEIEDARNSNP